MTGIDERGWGAMARLAWKPKGRGWYEATAPDGSRWRIVQDGTRRWVVCAGGDEVASWPTSLAEAKSAAEDEYVLSRERRAGYRRPARRYRPRLTGGRSCVIEYGARIIPRDGSPSYVHHAMPGGRWLRGRAEAEVERYEDDPREDAGIVTRVVVASKWVPAR